MFIALILVCTQGGCVPIVNNNVSESKEVCETVLSSADAYVASSLPGAEIRQRWCIPVDNNA